MNNEYYLPYQTGMQLTPERVRNCKNLGLILDKYPPLTVIGDGGQRRPWLKQLLESNHLDTRLAEQVSQRWQRAVQAMQAQLFNATTDWRMVVGLGGETILETDLTLHHIYGIPFIPGSALKGLTRAYVTGEIYKSDNIEKDDPIVQRIFGTQKDAGSVIFFDAMPTGGQVGIKLDIMNPHYPKYYGEKRPPANDQDPNPVPFLSVTDTTFMFAIARRTHSATDDVAQAISWLQEALQKYGVGGKTSAGYGYFQVEQSEPVVGQSIPEPYVRLNIPLFTAGQGMSGLTIAITDQLQSNIPEAKACLRYREFSSTLVVIAIEAEEATSWTVGQTKNCLFVREEVRAGCTILFCQPAASKKQKKGKKV